MAKKKTTRKTSPTERTLKRLRSDGWHAGVVEKWNTHGKFPRRIDLFGCIDVVAVHPARGVLGVQSTTTGNQASRRNKILDVSGDCAEPACCWLMGGGSLEVWGWGRYLVKRGGKAYRWKPTVWEMEAEMFSPVIIERCEALIQRAEEAEAALVAEDREMLF